MVQILALPITMHANTTVSKSILSLHVQLFFLNTTEVRLLEVDYFLSVLRGPLWASQVREKEKSAQHWMILCLVWFVGRSKVDLSSATVSFIKGVLGFVADGLRVITPQVIRLNNVWLKLPPPKYKKKKKKCCSFFQSQNSKKKQLSFKNKAGNLATRIPIVK